MPCKCACNPFTQVPGVDEFYKVLAKYWRFKPSKDSKASSESQESSPGVVIDIPDDEDDKEDDLSEVLEVIKDEENSPLKNPVMAREVETPLNDVDGGEAMHDPYGLFDSFEDDPAASSGESGNQGCDREAPVLQQQADQVAVAVVAAGGHQGHEGHPVSKSTAGMSDEDLADRINLLTLLCTHLKILVCCTGRFLVLEI